jgi:hypothetical protein
VNNGKSPTLVVPASVTGNIRDVSTDLGAKTVVFTTSAFGAYSVASSGEQQFVWAYKASGGFQQHDGRGFATFNFGSAGTPTEAPTKAPTANAPTKAPTTGSTPGATTTLCESTMSSDSKWGTKIVECAESTSTTCVVYEKLNSETDSTCDAFCALYGLACTAARHDSGDSCAVSSLGSFACDESPLSTSDHVCTCVAVPAGTESRWYTGEAGAPCDQTCAALTGSTACSADRTLAVTSWWKLRNVEAALAALLRDDARLAPACTRRTASDAASAPDIAASGACSFADKNGANAGTDTCSAFSAERQRVCCCVAPGENAAAYCPVQSADCGGGNTGDEWTWDATSGVCWPAAYAADSTKAFVGHGTLDAESASVAATDGSNTGDFWTPLHIALAVGGGAVLAGAVLAALIATIALIAVKAGGKIEQSGPSNAATVGVELAPLDEAKRTRNGRRALTANTPPAKPPKPHSTSKLSPAKPPKPHSMSKLRDASTSQLYRMRDRSTMAKLRSERGM